MIKKFYQSAQLLVPPPPFFPLDLVPVLVKVELEGDFFSYCDNLTDERDDFMLLIDICFTTCNASAAEFILYRLHVKLYLLVLSGTTTPHRLRLNFRVTKTAKPANHE